MQVGTRPGKRSRSHRERIRMRDAFMQCPSKAPAIVSALGPRLCENVLARAPRRIGFSIVFSRKWSPAFLFFKLMKSRRNF